MMTRISIVTIFVASLLAPHTVPGQSSTESDFLDPLLEVLQKWTGPTPGFSASGYCAFATGAALSVGYSDSSGLMIPVRQKLLWPGRYLSVVDSAAIPELRPTFRSSVEYLISQVSSGVGCLIMQPQPLVVAGVDTTLGAPWFILATTGDPKRDTVIWDVADLRAKWWRWSDAPGANAIWCRPDAPEFVPGQRMLLEGMRNLVLSARPDSVFGMHLGLAALDAVQRNPGHAPGCASTLMQMARLRESAGAFLTSQLDRWSPGDRDPIKLMAYYFQKDADAWRTLATVTPSWTDYDEDQRIDWVDAVLEWETKVAVALDEFLAESN